jgi:hypothetical protein
MIYRFASLALAIALICTIGGRPCEQGGNSASVKEHQSQCLTSLE